MPRLDDLRATRSGLLERMSECTSDQNYAVMGRLLLDVAKQIEEIEGAPESERKETGLSDFEKRLRERESGSKASRRANQA